jgi:integrase
MFGDVSDVVETGAIAQRRRKGDRHELNALRTLGFGRPPPGAADPLLLPTTVTFTAKRGTFVARPWVLHDLRRSARSLMSRAGVRPDIAERVLGHAMKEVEGTYDRHQYRDEKGHALKALAGLIESIINPADNVVRIAH